MPSEEALIMALCRPELNDISTRSLLSSDLDWSRVSEVAARNRLDAILFHSLDRLGVFPQLPHATQLAFENQYAQTVLNVGVYLNAAADLTEECVRRGLAVVVLRGLALGMTVYDKPYLRPFSDLDLLVRPGDFDAVRSVMLEMGYERRQGTLPEGYFRRHHLHVAMDNAATGVKAELHWALDHPYTLYTVDVGELIDSRQHASFMDEWIAVLTPEDCLLTLCLHLLKHAPFLADLMREDDFLPLLLRGRQMIWLLDIHQLLNRYGPTLNWDQVARKAGAWGLRDALAVCLEAVRRACGSDGTVKGPCAIIAPEGRGIRKRISRVQVKILRDNEPPSGLPRLLFGLRGDAVFRPVRALDLCDYLLPPREFMMRRYGAHNGPFLLWWYPVHVARAFGRLAANACEYFYQRIRGRPAN